MNRIKDLLKKLSLTQKIVLFFVTLLLLNFFFSSISQNPQKTTAEYQTSVISPSPLATPTPTPTPSPSPPTTYTYTYYTPGGNCPDVNQYIKDDNREVVCVSTGDWRGQGPIISIPIIGNVYGHIKRVTVDGKEVTWNKDGEIYTRLDLPIEYGTNKFVVETEDEKGLKSTKNLYINSEKPNDNPINLNVNQ